MASSPTTRTLAALRKDGGFAAVVEKWNPHARIRQDLFGFIDIVALTGVNIVGVQCTSTPNMASRVAKIMVECQDVAKAWLHCYGRIEVWGWAKRGPKGSVKKWTARVGSVELDSEGELVWRVHGQ